MPKIHILDDRLISQIAAGEVVERPASVVKELVENALDAGGLRIRVELASGGKRRILVRDDGCGMSAEDALLAFDRHATSKIAAFEDLDRVATLGFRGEALASISAVARVELLTAAEAGAGHRVRIEGARVLVAEPTAFPVGTRVEVRSLFFNVPARRKFLKSPQTELRRSLEVLQGYALARPELTFELSHEGRELLQASATSNDSGGRLERIAQIFGARIAAHLTEIPASGGVSGFVGDKTTSRGRRLFVFVNRRLVRDRALLAVFYRSVREQWKSDEFPALFLFLEIPAEEVDVNVHPQKTEVRFREAALLGRVGAQLRAALAEARGEELAPLRSPGEQRLPDLAWQGLGGAGGPSLIEPPAPWAQVGSEVRERRDGLMTVGSGALGELGSVGQPSSPGRRLAEVSYQPFEPWDVPVGSSPLSSGGTGSLRLLGQYKGSLILLEGPEALYLVDQHAAHERILYERFRRDLQAREVVSQRLLTPLLLDLSPTEAHALGAIAEALEEAGFSIAGLSGSSVGVTAVPVALSQEEAERVLLEVAGQGEASDAEERTRSTLRQSLLDALAASQACRAAVKIHRPMGREQMERVISDLFSAEEPFACPHGRPTILKMDDSELERRFGRRG